MLLFALHLRTATALQLLTGIYSPRSCEMLVIGYVNASGAPYSSHIQPETTHEVFPCTPSCEPVASNIPKIAKHFNFTRRGVAQYPYHRWIHGLHLKIAVRLHFNITFLQADIYIIFRVVVENVLRNEKLRSHLSVVNYWAQKRVKNSKKIWIIVHLHQWLL